GARGRAVVRELVGVAGVRGWQVAGGRGGEAGARARIGEAEVAPVTQLVEVTPESAGWRYVGFEVHRLGPGESMQRSTSDREVCLVMLSGKADVRFAEHEWKEIGGRQAVFDGPAASVEAP